MTRAGSRTVCAACGRRAQAVLLLRGRPVLSSKPISPPDNVRPRRVTGWSVIVSSVKIARGGLSLSPDAAQCTWRWSGVVGIVPCSSTIRRARCARRARAERRPRCDGAARARGGSRSRPSSSSARRCGRCEAPPRRPRGARTPPPRSPTRPSPRAAPRPPRTCALPGLEERTVQHPRIRGRIHVMSSGSVPRSSSQQMASNAVLPPPTIT